MATSERGFASMDPEKQRKIASKGGKTVSQDKSHMAEIGRRGGQNSHAGFASMDPERQREIASRGGKARKKG